MKKLFILLASALILVSCSNDVEITPTVEYVNISLSYTPSYNVDLVTRSTVGDNDLITVQVQQLTGSDVYSPIQSNKVGYFTKDSDIEFKLVKGSYYLIRSYVFKEVLDKLNISNLNHLYTPTDYFAVDLVTSYPNGNRKDYFPIDNYVGGIFFEAIDDVNIDLNMIHNVYGVTTNITGDNEGKLYVCSVPHDMMFNEEVSYHEIQSNETLKFQYWSSLHLDPNWLTTGDLITYENKLAEVDVYFKFVSTDGTEYEVPRIHLKDVKRGQNFIFNIDTDELVPANGSVDFNFIGDDSLSDIIYN